MRGIRILPLACLFAVYGLSAASCGGVTRSTEQSTISLAEESFSFTAIPVGDKASVSCRAITSVYLGQGSAGVDADETQRNRFRANISRGTDTIAIRIEPEYLVFLTRAGLEAGVAEGSRFPIVENTQNYLKASESMATGVATLESFVLNKQNGLAIWARIRPLGFFGGLAQAAPDSETVYLACV